MSEKNECKKGANGIAFCNYEWCETHPKLCSKSCKTCTEPKKDTTYVSARPQREGQAVSWYVDDDGAVDDETTSQRVATILNDPGIKAVRSLKNLCLAVPATISLNNMPSELRRNQPDAGTVIQGMGSNARQAEATMINLFCGIVESCAAIILPGDPAFLFSRAIEKLEAKRSKPSLKKKAEAADKLVTQDIN
jgi:hypothetical protein